MTTDLMIPFYKPWSTGEEIRHIRQAIANQAGPDARFYTLASERRLEEYTGCGKALLTPSGTAALEMAALLGDIQPGDEVIMSSFTFPAMANAFVLRGGVPVFVDIRPDTLNIDERLIEAAITPRTRALVVMHYGGVACEMDTIMALARRHELLVIEDAAHALGATYKGRPLGSIGHLSALSFHKTKNIQCGEGGALLINDARFASRAEIIQEHGTDRARFNRRQIPKYSWVDIGSSYLMSELNAAYLYSQLQQVDHVLAQRRTLWQQYRHHLSASSAADPEHNAHIYHCLAASPQHREQALATLQGQGIQATSHYQPLHSSKAGKHYGRCLQPLAQTDRTAATLLRLPMWIGMTESDTARVAGAYTDALPMVMAS